MPSTTRTLTVYRQGEAIEFTTTLTNNEALGVLENNSGNGRANTFAGSLVAQAHERGRLSEKQWAWVCYLAAQYQQPQQPQAPAATLPRAVALFDMLQAAKAQIKFPKVVVWCTLEEGYRLSIAGSRAKVPGSLTVTSAEQNAYGERQWYGRILQDGTIHAGRSWPTWLTAALERFAAQPALVAQESSRLHGACSFCNRGLKDERSTEVGYGPQCAKRFGLPWGTTTTTGTLPTLDATEAAMNAQFAAYEAATEAAGFASDPDYRQAMATM